MNEKASNFQFSVSGTDLSVDNGAQADGLLYRFRNNGELVNSL